MFDAPESPEHPHHTGHRWVDFTLAGAALLVSVVSLTVAVLHGRTMEQMADANARLVQANSWPFITLLLNSADERLQFGVRNSGVGPAKIYWLEVFLDGRPLRSAHELLVGGLSSGSGHVLVDTSSVDGSVLRAGEATTVTQVTAAHTDPSIYARLRSEFAQLRIRTCYCSVFDECFISDGQSLRPQPVKVCPRPAAPFDTRP